jgi:dienelactone hydrolase
LLTSRWSVCAECAPLSKRTKRLSEAGGWRLTRCVALLVLASISQASAQAETPPVEVFRSSGKKIRLERFSPTDAGRHPVVFLTYGAAGLTTRGDALRDYARQLAGHGYVVYLIHYFDATDSATAGELPLSPSKFKLWTKALQDGITYAAKNPQADRHRIGVLGFSLGAFLALSESSQDSRVKVVCEYYGGDRRLSIGCTVAERSPPRPMAPMVASVDSPPEREQASAIKPTILAIPPCRCVHLRAEIPGRERKGSSGIPQRQT